MAKKIRTNIETFQTKILHLEEKTITSKATKTKFKIYQFIFAGEEEGIIRYGDFSKEWIDNYLAQIEEVIPAFSFKQMVEKGDLVNLTCADEEYEKDGETRSFRKAIKFEVIDPKTKKAIVYKKTYDTDSIKI